MAYHPDDMYINDHDKLCGRNRNVKFGGEWDSEIKLKRRAPNQPKKVYYEPKYPNEPTESLHLGGVFLSFVSIIIIGIIIYNI